MAATISTSKDLLQRVERATSAAQSLLKQNVQEVIAEAVEKWRFHAKYTLSSKDSKLGFLVERDSWDFVTVPLEKAGFGVKRAISLDTFTLEVSWDQEISPSKEDIRSEDAEPELEGEIFTTAEECRKKVCRTIGIKVELVIDHFWSHLEGAADRGRRRVTLAICTKPDEISYTSFNSDPCIYAGSAIWEIFSSCLETNATVTHSVKCIAHIVKAYKGHWHYRWFDNPTVTRFQQLLKEKLAEKGVKLELSTLWVSEIQGYHCGPITAALTF